ncbi:hypothetical protein MOF10_04810 [Bacillus inaquosorum]|uniref:hypothetical protein n=1 Tax=Bacillus inaquosorum TaxID=483913 RepID=UPI00227ED65C|nr:hypothetical protein [Bacillus inaquosorum]MCY7785281.1 hypothetical protein [Bacillus inaquosorum]MCY9296183.1 hypothetical protein [Bacillus inaquosorum]
MMLFVKKHAYPLTVISLILCIVASLIIFNAKLAPFSNILSAMIGALLGSMGPYFIGLQNQKNEYKGAKRRIARLLKYTHDVFSKENLEEYYETLKENVAIGKIIYDDQWTSYLSFLDRDDLSHYEIQLIVKWFDRIYILEKKNEISDVIYYKVLEGLREIWDDIDTIIKKLNSHIASSTS